MSANRAAPWLCALVVAVLCALAPAAQAELGVSATMATIDEAGQPENRAGSHPDRLVQSFTVTDLGGAPEDPKEIVIDLPAGMGGDPAAVPLCPRQRIIVFLGSCPPESQIGVLKGPEGDLPIYSVEPAPNEAALFAAIPELVPIMFFGQLRSEDQGLSLRLIDLEQASDNLIEDGKIELWGVPADHQAETSIPRKALLTLPTRCDAGPLTASVRMRSWQQPDRWVQGGASTGQALTGCGDLGFQPRFDFSFDAAGADAPSGARVDLTVPQNADPDGRASSQLREMSIAMPLGTTLALGSAAGLRTCSDAQLGLGTAADPTCPGASRVGSVELSGPSLGKAMTGAIYLGQERPNDRFRLFVVASAKGSVTKFAASLRPDPLTGQLTTRLTEMPQVPFERMSLRFDGGPRALLATPLSCGPAATSAKLTPYSGSPAVNRVGAVTVGGGACGPPPFAPSVTGGATSIKAGKPTGFTATLRRRDGEQLPGKLEITLPPGFSAALGKVDTCPAAAVPSGACPAGSLIGHTVAELGPGTNPARLDGNIYLTDKYLKAPFGFALVFRAAVGPFDLGTVVVRAGLDVDAETGQVRIQTDSLAPSFEGIPVRFQTIGLDIDRPGFMRNPTSCAPAVVASMVRSESGAISRSSSPFAIRGCIDLPFRPRIAVALSKRRELRKGGKPGVRISGRVPSGNANLRSAKIGLPRLLKFDPSELKAICSRSAAVDGRCPAGARIGAATARTPMLKAPLKGSVYAVQPRGKGTPDVWAHLKGSGLEIALKTETSSDRGRVATKLVDLPDFTLSSFALSFAGGERGVFKLKGSPCVNRKRGLAAPVEAEGQNGALEQSQARVTAAAACGRGK
jgi:hypothetical protein